MSHAARRRWRLAAVALAWAAALAARPAAAQIGDEDEPEAPAQPGAQQFMVDESNFDAWIFQGRDGGSGARDQLAAQVKFEIEELDRECQLTEPQKAKLNLAAAGDLKRFFVIYDEEKERFQGVRNDQQKFSDFFQELQPLIQKVQRGLFGPASLFAKAVAATLTPEQEARHAEFLRERNSFHYRAQVELAAAVLAGPLGLNDEQCRKFIEVLMAEPAPVTRVTNQSFPLVMFKASQVEEAKLRPIFDEVQWRALSKQITNGKGMEPLLKMQGALGPPGQQAAPPRRAGGVMILAPVRAQAAVPAGRVIQAQPAGGAK